MAEPPRTLPRGARVPGVRLASRALRRPRGRIGAVLLGGFVILGILGPALAPFDPFAISGPPLAPPGPEHPMGTDALGRDLASAVLYGARTSLLVAAGVGVLAGLLGLALGAVAGWVGGWMDDLLMRATEVVQVIPRFFLAVLAIALFGPGLGILTLVLGLTSWTTLARVVRAEVLTLRGREFVLAARAAGAAPARVLWTEVVPNALPPAVALLGLVLGRVLLVEAGLGFLGLGDPSAVSWGHLAARAQPFLRAGPWLALFPGLAIVLAVLGFNLLGDAFTAAGRRR